MRDYLASEVRNIVMLGHSGSGKSSVIESILFFNNIIDRMGNTASGNTAMDYDTEEIKRNLSVYTALAPVEIRKLISSILLVTLITMEKQLQV